jgi:hypothetical protein
MSLRLMLRCDGCGTVKTAAFDHDRRGTAREVRELLRLCGWRHRGARDWCTTCVASGRHDKRRRQMLIPITTEAVGDASGQGGT